jgi:hypothetical protein
MTDGAVPLNQFVLSLNRHGGAKLERHNKTTQRRHSGFPASVSGTVRRRTFNGHSHDPPLSQS